MTQYLQYFPELIDKTFWISYPLLRDCNDRTPFINSAALQRFDHRQDGRIQLRNSDLCIAACEESSETYSAMDSWRTLYLQKCDRATIPYSTWRIRTP